MAVEFVCEKLIKRSAEKNISTSFSRVKTLKPCPFGEHGTCCKNCSLGPCRINPKDYETGCGICGATADTIAARNFGRMIASGAAAHSDHGRSVARTFIGAARGDIPGYSIKDVGKLMMMAELFGIETAGKTKNQIGEELGRKALAEYGKQEGEIIMVNRAPKPRQEIWRKLGIVPRGIDIEVVEMLHRTSMGTDQDYEHIMMQGSKCSLSDGWGGSMIATELQDIMFGTPIPVRGKVSLGVLKKDEVNIIVHGHEPLLSEIMVMVAQSGEMVEYAKSKGAKGISIGGICCTANEILSRHGIPVLGSFSQQELAIVTGAVDAMVVDVQCIMQGLEKIAKCFHTHLITTSSKAKIRGAIHIEVDEHNPVEAAKTIIRDAIDNYKNRGPVEIPQEDVDIVVGFSHETINYMLGGKFRASYRPLNDNIMNGRILGVAGVVGCDTAREGCGINTSQLIRELIANDVLVVQTGCAAIVSARDGLMVPEAAKYAGPGLAEVCETVGIPPVLHLGACVDNSRILIAASAMVEEGGLGNDISDLPVAGCCPDWMNEKAITIGQYFVASGVYTVFSPSLWVGAAKGLAKLLFEDFEKSLKGKWAVGKSSSEMAGMMIDHIRKKRQALGIDKSKDRVLFDMAMRRELQV